ncbi:DUF2993 domain-containing protein [Microbacterium sp. YJN-G]|uniref:LmeA family phospholipid-binding protein n=1 Tax=Microbacterium sp. YJN-G TaxID=2763257 RepID=UPI0018784767|nr:DUF2993 domain-containing protein [Microbacterium sp. YJN-G]
MTGEPIGTAKRRRARWPWVLLIVVVLLAALVVVAEAVARTVVPSTVRSLVISELELPADQQLDVEARGILLPQLIGGSLDELRLSSDAVTIGGITGAADVTATGVPLRGGELGSATGTVAIGQGQFARLLENSQLPGAELTLDEPNVTLQGSVPLFARDIPFGFTFTPGADGGDLLIMPVSVTLGGSEIELSRLATLLGEAGKRLAEPQRVCIADRLPAGITLTGLRIEGTRAVADISADGRIAVDPALLDPGTC